MRVRSSDPPLKRAAQTAGPPGQSLYPEAGTGGPKYITWEQDTAGLNNVRLQVRRLRTRPGPPVARGHPATCACIDVNGLSFMAENMARLTQVQGLAADLEALLAAGG